MSNLNTLNNDFYNYCASSLPRYYVLSWSGGSDSTALFIEILKRSLPLNEVVYFNISSDFEYSFVKSHKKMVMELCQKRGILFTELKPKYNIEAYIKYFGWCGSENRWLTGVKTKIIDAHVLRNLENYCVVQYIGYNNDERLRAKKHYSNNGFQCIYKYPLIQYKIDKEQTISICNKSGFTLDYYKYCSRVSCPFCYYRSIEQSIYLANHECEIAKKIASIENNIKKPSNCIAQNIINNIEFKKRMVNYNE